MSQKPPIPGERPSMAAAPLALTLNDNALIDNSRVVTHIHQVPPPSESSDSSSDLIDLMLRQPRSTRSKAKRSENDKSATEGPASQLNPTSLPTSTAPTTTTTVVEVPQIVVPESPPLAPRSAKEVAPAIDLAAQSVRPEEPGSTHASSEADAGKRAPAPETGTVRTVSGPPEKGSQASQTLKNQRNDAAAFDCIPLDPDFRKKLELFKTDCLVSKGKDLVDEAIPALVKLSVEVSKLESKFEKLDKLSRSQNAVLPKQMIPSLDVHIKQGTPGTAELQKKLANLGTETALKVLSLKVEIAGAELAHAKDTLDKESSAVMVRVSDLLLEPLTLRIPRIFERKSVANTELPRSDGTAVRSDRFPLDDQRFVLLYLYFRQGLIDALTRSQATFKEAKEAREKKEEKRSDASQLEKDTPVGEKIELTVMKHLSKMKQKPSKPHPARKHKVKFDDAQAEARTRARSPSASAKTRTSAQQIPAPSKVKPQGKPSTGNGNSKPKRSGSSRTRRGSQSYPTSVSDAGSSKNGRATKSGMNLHPKKKASQGGAPKKRREGGGDERGKTNLSSN